MSNVAELPKLIVDYWNMIHPTVLQFKWEYLNSSHDEDGTWGCDVYLVEGENHNEYLVLTNGGMVRIATKEEIHFLLTGETPE